MKYFFITALSLLTAAFTAKAQVTDAISVQDLRIENRGTVISDDTASGSLFSTADSAEVEKSVSIHVDLRTVTENGDSVNLQTSSQIETLLENYIFQNRENANHSGYRIQIASFNSAEKEMKELENMRDRFEESFPDIPAYLIYTVPDFKIRAGNYRNKLESLPDLHRIREIYPESYTVKCEITAKELARLPLMVRLEQEAAAKARHLEDSLRLLYPDTLINDSELFQDYIPESEAGK